MSMSYEGMNIPVDYKEEPSENYGQPKTEGNVFDYREKIREYENEIRNLREKLTFSESRLAKLQDYNNVLNEKLSKAENELKVFIIHIDNIV